MSHTVLVLDDVHPSVEEVLTKKGFKSVFIQDYDKEKILNVIEDVDAIIYRSFATEIDEKILTKAKKLKCIVRTGGGMGRINYEVATTNNVVIMHTRGCNSFTAAEFIFTSMLNLARKLSVADKAFRNGITTRDKFWGVELAGKTLGIIGFGKMGKFLSKMANSFRMNVISYSPHLTTEEEIEYNVEGLPLKELYQRSDFISIAFPVRKEHLGMFNKESFAIMKEGVFLINMTTMYLFKEEDLVEALKQKKIGGIVMERPYLNPLEDKHPLLNFPNVLFTQALGSHTHEGQAFCASQAVNQVVDYIHENKISNQIKLNQ